jgi:mycothiol synthase
MRPTFRPYRGDDDAWRLRAFLRAAFLAHDRRARSWHVARFDYARWHASLNVAGVPLEDVAFLWEEGGEVVGLVMPEGGPGEAHLSIHPQRRSAGLEAEMLDVAEERLSEPSDGGRRLVVWAMADDDGRRSELERRGYVRHGAVETQWRRRLDRALPPAPVAPGYVVRPVGDGLELLERCYASGLAFHDGDTRIAVDNRDDPSWYRNVQTAPLYRRDLDLVAVAPDGAIAAFCTVWFDDVTRSAYLEPVATVPAHRRRGLGRAVATEGLRQARRLGADLALVFGYTTDANDLYRVVMTGFDTPADDRAGAGEPDTAEAWVRTW